jgi:hypothetical protein
MHMEAGTPDQPGANSRMLMRRVVVANDVHLKVGWNIGLDVSQEGQIFLMPMLGLALRKTLPFAMSRAANSVVVPWRT